MPKTRLNGSAGQVGLAATRHADIHCRRPPSIQTEISTTTIENSTATAACD
jgi:hypothetical protein